MYVHCTTPCTNRQPAQIGNFSTFDRNLYVRSPWATMRMHGTAASEWRARIPCQGVKSRSGALLYIYVAPRPSDHPTNRTLARVHAWRMGMTHFRFLTGISMFFHQWATMRTHGTAPSEWRARIPCQGVKSRPGALLYVYVAPRPSGNRLSRTPARVHASRMGMTRRFYIGLDYCATFGASRLPHRTAA